LHSPCAGILVASHYHMGIRESQNQQLEEPHQTV